MKIYELVKELNKKTTIKSSKVFEIKKYYLSMYRTYMIELYDNGYISDPTVFDNKEILRNIVDMDIKYLTGVNGKIELTEEYIGFALAKYKDDEEISNFLSILLNAIKYRNISMNIDKFYDASGFDGDGSKKLSMNVAQAASKVFSKNGYDIDEGVLKCFYGVYDSFKFISLDEVIYDVALDELRIVNDGDSSMFVKGLTKEEEIRYSSLILNGYVKLDGDFAEVLVDWLNKNKWAEGNRFSSQNEGLYNWVLYVNSADMMERQSVCLNKLLDEEYKVVGMKSNGFYVVDEKAPVLYPVGVFAIDSGDEDTILPSINVLEGYTGEVFSVEYLESQEIGYVGCPVELFVDNKNKELFVDKEQTELAYTMSWFSDSGSDVDITFDGSTYVKGVYPEGSVEDKLFRIVGDSEGGELIGVLSREDLDSLANAKKVVGKRL